MRRVVLGTGLLSDVGRVAKRGATAIHGCVVHSVGEVVELRVSGMSERTARLLGTELYSTARVVIEVGASDTDAPSATAPRTYGDGLRAALAAVEDEQGRWGSKALDETVARVRALLAAEEEG
jgi:hypothetical protein